MQVPRKLSRLKNKESSQTTRRYVSSKDFKAPKSIQIPKKGKYKDNDNNEDKNSHLKLSFWGSPDLSVGVENLFKLIKLHEDARFLIISLNLCNVGNMIQLSDQVLHDVTTLFSRQGLRDPNFQDAIVKI
jgi:hypothetical protein